MAFLVALPALAAAIVPASAAAEPAPGTAGWIFQPDKVVVIDLTLSQEAEEALEDEPDEYVEGGFRLSTTNGTPGGEEQQVGPTLDEVGIRLKGSASFEPLTGKAAFKVKFKEFSGPKYEGLKKLTLNNMVEDPSMIHEALAYTAFRGVGVPASRSGYAYVRVNGEDYGLYANVESLDDVALERWFGEFEDPPQHLYEGEDGHDVTPGGAGAFEADEGDEANRSDLEALIAAVNTAPGEGWSAQMAPVADLAEMTRMWAVEKYVGQWDGYSGQEGDFQPNNYYLYSSPTGVFQMLPWGTDETWDRRIAFDGPAGLMFNRCLADPACEALYRKELRAVGAAIAALDLESMAQNTATLLKPWEEIDPRRPYGDAHTEDAVEETEEFIADRPGELEAWVGPEEEATEEEAIAHDDSSPGPGVETGSTAALPPAPPAPARLGANASLSHGWFLNSRLRLPAAGKVWQKVTLQTAKGRIHVCSAHARVKEAGEAVLRCSLPQSIRRRLRARWLKLLVTVRFESATGEVQTFSSKVVVPRKPGG